MGAEGDFLRRDTKEILEMKNLYLHFSSVTQVYTFVKILQMDALKLIYIF